MMPGWGSLDILGACGNPRTPFFRKERCFIPKERGCRKP